MKNILCLCCCLTNILPLAAQDFPVQQERELADVVVTAERLLSNIGIQQTILDSTTLRQTVSLSLADVLTQNSTIFIKSYGRGALSTASFRGTAPSHTQVTWNGMKIDSPMLGQVDFSLIPSFFVDKANLYHGASSTGITGGGLGGAIALGTRASGEKGLGMQYIQGVGSYHTFDEFFRLQYGTGR
ncbi:MAG: Plug domain-containing protein [Tannerellaceae bacterium]|nr:Plug domain-containing protein [Tannerellaceae bacterium]